MREEALKRAFNITLEKKVDNFIRAVPTIAPTDYSTHFSICPCGGRMVSKRVDASNIYATCESCDIIHLGRCAQ